MRQFVALRQMQTADDFLGVGHARLPWIHPFVFPHRGRVGAGDVQPFAKLQRIKPDAQAAFRRGKKGRGIVIKVYAHRPAIIGRVREGIIQQAAIAAAGMEVMFQLFADLVRIEP